VEVVYFMYGRSVSTEGWKGFSLDVEIIIENLCRVKANSIGKGLH
jgi:hypothetical protein